MSDEFGTMDIKRGDRGREIEVMRSNYRQHRDALSRMAAEAPTEHLASEYHRLIREIDGSMRKLDELDGGMRAHEDLGTQPGIAYDDGDATIAASRRETDAGSRPLPGQAAMENALPATALPNPQSRIILILLAGVILVGLIGWMTYRASRDKRHTGTITETSTTSSSTVSPPAEERAPAAPAAAADLSISPASASYGEIRKGTRAVRQFQITNTTTSPVAIKVSRSTCRCLYYEYREILPAKGKATITVTIDGARAKAGAMTENVHVTSKKDPSLSASFDVSATIQ